MRAFPDFVRINIFFMQAFTNFVRTFTVFVHISILKKRVRTDFMQYCIQCVLYHIIFMQGCTGFMRACTRFETAHIDSGTYFINKRTIVEFHGIAGFFGIPYDFAIFFYILSDFTASSGLITY